MAAEKAHFRQHVVEFERRISGFNHRMSQSPTGNSAGSMDLNGG
jgi:hypothetical protein